MFSQSQIWMRFTESTQLGASRLSSVRVNSTRCESTQRVRVNHRLDGSSFGSGSDSVVHGSGQLGSNPVNSVNSVNSVYPVDSDNSAGSTQSYPSQLGSTQSRWVNSVRCSGQVVSVRFSFGSG
ncbi:hypothetical protein HanPI659440_Chr14g0543821 [Helianthus annuus]|nr:hypothetical protein HanPI659440_Chr14g0543821 [Helianthus annuus]